MPRRAKPKSPTEIAADKAARNAALRAAAFEAVGLQGEAAGLVRNADVAVRHAERDRVDGAQRLDAFEALKADMARRAPGAYDAARRLERDMAVRRGETDRGRTMERVDGGGVFGGWDVRIEAGRRVDAVLGRIGERDAWLLTELIEPRVDRGGWRGTVAQVTGETNEVAQGGGARGVREPGGGLCGVGAGAGGVRGGFCSLVIPWLDHGIQAAVEHAGAVASASASFGLGPMVKPWDDEKRRKKGPLDRLSEHPDKDHNGALRVRPWSPRAASAGGFVVSAPAPATSFNRRP